MIEVYDGKKLNAELRKNKRVVAFFYATWCPYCRRFIPIFNNRISNAGFESVIYVILDDYDNQLWDTYDISAVPTVILFKEGAVCSRLDGRLGLGLSEKRFLEWLEEVKRDQIKP